VGETRPYRVRVPLTKHLNRAKVVIVKAALVHHVETKMEIELASMTNKWSSWGLEQDTCSMTSQLSSTEN